MRRTPPPIQTCTYPDHPARRHGHYGAGPYWCSDFNSPLLSADNGGHVQGGYILIFEKSAATS
jgi:hypothetical protein